MRRLVVFVNGLPGSGKTTLARPLATALRLPLLGKDAMKETAADVLGVTPPPGWAQREWSRALGAAAMEIIWTLLHDFHTGAVVESNLLADTRKFVSAGLARAGLDPVRDTVEVWCDVVPALARQRFEQRVAGGYRPYGEAGRHPVHGDQLGLADEWDRWLAQAQPLGLGPVVEVDTSATVNLTALVAQIATAHYGA